MKIAVLGLGLMGTAIAGRLQQQAFKVVGWNRSAHSLDAATTLGLSASTDPAIADAADTLILTLSDAEAITGALFEKPGFALAGKTVIQMGTIAPAESRDLEARVRAEGGHYLEAPVLGSIPEARAGTLIIMAGGDAAVYERCLPLLTALSGSPQHVGATGKGAALKLAMNQLIGALTTAFSASLGLVRAEGIDVDQFMELLRSSALYAPTFDKKLTKMLEHDYARPNFPLKHLIKDTRLFARAATEQGIDTRVIAALTEVFEDGRRKGYADDDYSALYEAVNPGKV